MRNELPTCHPDPERSEGEGSPSIVRWSLVLGGFLAALGMTLLAQPALLSQTQAAADEKSRGCLACHKNIEPMHTSPAVRLGCTDCHGGNAAATTKDAAHVKPLHPEIWKSSANPPRTYTALLQESPQFVQFVNPGDLRVAEETRGGCHQKEV